MSFKYKIIKRPDKTEVKTPSIPVVIKGNGEVSLEAVALIDSGADISVIPKDFAELLNLDLSGEKTKAFGIGGEVESVESTVNLSVNKGHETYSFTIPIKIIFGAYDFPVLLGREGFFDQFIIIFDQKNQKISLKKTTEKY